MGLTLDPTRLEAALRLVEATTGRSMAESLDRAALTALIGGKGVLGAMQLTPKADKAKIRAVTDAQLKGAVIRKAKAKGNWPLKPEELKKLIKRERASRASAAGYTAYAGWNNAAKAFGGRGIGNKLTSRFGRSEARRGSGKRANPMDLVATMINTAPVAEQIGSAALQKALDNAASDLEDYAARKIQEILDQVTF